MNIFVRKIQTKLLPLKRDRLILGMLLGGILMFFLMTIFSLTGSRKLAGSTTNDHPSLDALLAAPTFHRLLLDNEKARVTELVVPPGKQTPVFRYAHRSLTWVTNGTPIVLTTYKFTNSGALSAISSDTIAIRPDELNRSSIEVPGAPFSITNISNETYRQYRIEWKN